MRPYLRSRSVGWLTVTVLTLTAILIAPLGAVPMPKISYMELSLEVPVRNVGMILLGSLPVLAYRPEMDAIDRSGARPVGLVRVAVPMAVLILAVVAASAGSMLVNTDAEAMVRNVLIGAAGAAALRPLLGVASFLPVLLGSTLAAGLRIDHGLMSVTNADGTAGALASAGLAASIGLAVLARSSASKDTV